MDQPRRTSGQRHCETGKLAKRSQKQHQGAPYWSTTLLQYEAGVSESLIIQGSR